MRINTVLYSKNEWETNFYNYQLQYVVSVGSTKYFFRQECGPKMPVARQELSPSYLFSAGMCYTVRFFFKNSIFC